MESAGWSFDMDHADGNKDNVLPHCGDGDHWFGWSGGDTVGTLASPPLEGSGTATIEFGNCWNNGNVKLYLNDELIDTAATDGSKTDRTQSKTFSFQAGDVVKLTDEGAELDEGQGGGPIINLKSVTITCDNGPGEETIDEDQPEGGGEYAVNKVSDNGIHIITRLDAGDQAAPFIAFPESVTLGLPVDHTDTPS